ncbi:GNAT family N-acetyltransferase [Deefgea salmonis]|uniref:GNAT family N-acetyltransferase n=1 Tax=Deefgea salmonis TaxID=2875502 RepID=A0ABS8BNY7_9NEIS|nr:GNAT family N-acetyltransferase [Deefgea salmonis]MCB5197447.1 GNAT family N-acetyltransferase [Deefgea salmonis]
MMNIVWRWLTFDEFDTPILFQYLQLRQQVFIVEQACAYADIDDLDLVATHLLAYCDDRLVACLRLVPPGLKYAEPSLGRVITRADFRGTGLGYQLISRGLKGAVEQYPGLNNKIGAQAHLQDFYAKSGFATVSAPYLEDDISHVDMLWQYSPIVAI